MEASHIGEVFGLFVILLFKSILLSVSWPCKNAPFCYKECSDMHMATISIWVVSTRLQQKMHVLNKYGGAERETKKHQTRNYKKCVISMMLFVLMSRKGLINWNNRSKCCHHDFSCLFVFCNVLLKIILNDLMQRVIFGGPEDFAELLASTEGVHPKCCFGGWIRFACSKTRLLHLNGLKAVVGLSPI